MVMVGQLCEYREVQKSVYSCDYAKQRVYSYIIIYLLLCYFPYELPVQIYFASPYILKTTVLYTIKKLKLNGKKKESLFMEEWTKPI